MERHTSPFKRRSLAVRQRSQSAWDPLMAPSSKELTTKTGTERYMAPECYSLGETGAYTNAVDVFSFAILSHEVLSRCRAYEDTYMTMQQVARSVNETGLRPRLPRGWSDELKDLMSRMWAQQPMDRPSFEQIAETLADFLQRGAQAEGGVSALLGIADGAAIGCCAVQ